MFSEPSIDSRSERSFAIRSIASSRQKHKSLETEDGKSWKRAVFIIFEPFWMICIDLNIFLNALFVIYTIFYLDETPILATIIYYFFEVHFIVDTALSILHMKWDHIRRFRYHEPKHMSILIYSVATLLPFYEMYYLLLPRSDTPARDFVRLKCVLRFMVLYVHLFSVNHRKVNTFFDLLIKLVVILLSMTLIMSTVWYINYWKSNRYGIMEKPKYKQYISLTKDDSFGWFIGTYVKTMNVFLQNLSVGIYGKANNEVYLLILILILGFNVIYITFISNLITNYIHHRPVFYLYLKSINNTRRMMQRWKVNDNTQSQVMAYCQQFWYLRQGCLGMPELFSVLPISSRKDITLDIFWEMFRHSRLFRDMETTFKRTLSIYVQNEFILPGTYLYRKGHRQSKLYYIVSGNAQVLSNEQTPVINLTSGTILGEVNILIPNISLASIVSTDTCVLHTLELSHFYRAIANTKYNGKYFFDQLKSRITYAKRTEAIKQRKLKSYETLEDKYSTPIKRIKTLWSTILAMEEGTLTYDIFRHNSGFCSKYLDLLVMNKNLHKSLDRGIILANECPLVFRPNSSFRKMIYFASIIATILHSISLPYCAVFLQRVPKALFDICIVFDIICWLELCIDLVTAVNMPNKQITVPGDIILYKMKSMAFFFDFISCLPIDYIGYVNNTKSHTAALLKLNRVIRIYKLHQMLLVWEQSTSGPRVILKKLVKYSTLYFYFSYFFSCTFYALTCPTNCVLNGWFIKKYGEDIQASQFERFFSSFNLAISLVMRCHFVFTIAYNVIDNLGFLCATFIGYVLFAFCVTEFTSYNLQNSLRNNVYLQRFRNFHEILYKSKINPYFIKQVVHHIDWNWRNRPIIDEIENCVELPNNLNDGIEIHRLVKLFKKLQVFETFPDKILQGIARISTIKVLPPNVVVVSKGQYIHYLHVIEEGECVSYYERFSKDYVNAQNLVPGSAFPVIAGFLKDLSLITVSTSTNVILVNVPIDRLFLHLQVYDMADIYDFCKSTSFSDVVQVDLTENEIYDAQHEQFLAQIIARQKYHMKQIYDAKMKSLGRFYFLKYLLLKETLYPEDMFMRFWETIRCICAITHLIINLFALSLLFRYSLIIFVINLLLDILAIADIYVRLHVQYYNEIGILIVHPVCTATHYIQTSLLVDMYGAFPAYYFNIYKIFVSVNSWRNYHLTVIFTRTAQLYRVFGVLNYFISVLKGGKLILIRTFQLYLIFLIIGVLFINILLANACEYNDASLTFNCESHVLFKSNSWKTTEPYILWTMILYIYATFFTGTSTGFMHVVDFYNTIGFYVIIIAMFALRVYIMVFFIISMMSDSFETIINRNTIKTYVEFSKKENVMDTVIFARVLEDFHFRWQKTRGINFIKELATINEYMRYKLLDTLFGGTIMKVSLFEGISANLIGMILGRINLEHYNKGSMIISCNDIQDRFYIVYKGSVQVYLVGDISLNVLHAGGAFGSISNNGFTRQTINVQAQVHCQVLYIKTDILNVILKNSTEIYRQLKYSRFLNQEYFPTNKIVSDKMKTMTSASLFRSTKLSNAINEKIRIGDDWVKKVAAIFYLHFIPWTTIVTIFLYSQTITRCVSLLTLLLFNYCIDLTFWLRAFLEMHLYYTDLDSGNIITNSEEIRKRYLTSYKFVLDCIILIPFETIILIFSRSYAVYGFVPRILRMVHFFQYYKVHKMQMNVHFQFTFYIYFYILVVLLFAGFFVEFLCDPDKCGVVSLTYAKETCDARAVFQYLKYGLMYGIQMLTTTNYKNMLPVSSYTLLLISIAQLSAPYLVVLMIFSITTFINSTNYTKMKFFVKIKEFDNNLKNQNVSPTLRKTSTEYLLKIWQTNKGENIPNVIETSPRFLRESFLMHVYGYHLREHFLFSDTHVDFLRQLVPILQRMIYLPDSQIVEAGDNDGCMYFIHSGEISVRSSTQEPSGEQINAFVLKTSDAFGENCGLFNLPHEHSYICNTVVDLLVLQKSNWDFLLKFFPASHEMILKRAKEYQVSGAYL